MERAGVKSCPFSLDKIGILVYTISINNREGQ
jgi:hypothetical protein